MLKKRIETRTVIRKNTIATANRKSEMTFQIDRKTFKAIPGARRLVAEGRSAILLIRKQIGYLRRPSIISKYFEHASPRKLHIGSGSRLIDGWLNTDFFPFSRAICLLDATKVFPFDDNSFDYIFSEHMIEHIDFEEATAMLKECFRVLKIGGKIRISTPNFSFLMALYNPTTQIEIDYIKYSCHTFLRPGTKENPVFVINNFFRDWGHKFIYDEIVLREQIEGAGFSLVKSCMLNASEDPHLCGLENADRMPEGFLGLETITVEGVRLS
jgi:predicted SAM-dependent methyltransferase